MVYYNNTFEFYHHGIKGQKWGVRRFQNKDGTLTRRGRAQYRKEESQRIRKEASRIEEEANNKAYRFAKKNKIDTDDYVFADDSNSFLKQNKNSSKAKAIVEYSRMLDKAEDAGRNYVKKETEKMNKFLQQQYDQHKLNKKGNKQIVDRMIGNLKPNI